MSYALLMILLAIAGLILVRNVLVWRCHRRRIDEIHATNMSRLDAGRYEDMLDYSHVGDYESHMLDLRKWTYKQFYGSMELAEIGAKK